MINTISVEKAFKKIGADVLIREEHQNRFTRNQSNNPSIDVRPVKSKETFILTLPMKDIDKIEMTVLDSQPKLKHLLLFVRNQDASTNKYLCGHDERHWFVSAVNGTSVMNALQNLKPKDVQNHEKNIGVKRARKHKHHNEAWTRQGEWFFLPAPEFDPNGEKITLCSNEPISRGRGSKPHMCEELARRGGQTVWVSRRYPNGITQKQYEEVQKTEEGKRQIFQARVVNAEVFVRGKIRHTDHKTINLKTWHRVLMNSEIVSSSVRFLD